MSDAARRAYDGLGFVTPVLPRVLISEGVVVANLLSGLEPALGIEPRTCRLRTSFRPGQQHVPARNVLNLANRGLQTAQ